MPPVLRPRTVLITGIVLSAVLVAASALGWMLLPAEIRVLFTVPQLLTLGLFVLVMIAIMIAVGLSTVRIEPDGLRIRNGVRSHWNSRGSSGPSKSRRAGGGGNACAGSAGAGVSTVGTPRPSSVRSQASAPQTIRWMAVSRPRGQRPRFRRGRPQR